MAAGAISLRSVGVTAGARRMLESGHRRGRAVNFHVYRRRRSMPEAFSAARSSRDHLRAGAFRRRFGRHACGARLRVTLEGPKKAQVQADAEWITLTNKICGQLGSERQATIVCEPCFN